MVGIQRRRYLRAAAVVWSVVMALLALRVVATHYFDLETARGGTAVVGEPYAGPVPPMHAAPPGPSSGRPPTPLPASVPERIEIARIGVASTLVPLGTDPDGTVQVPPVEDAMQAGWYRFGSTAGETGPFVVLGHVDSYKSAGVFIHLHELHQGDLVRVYRADKVVVTYVIDRTEQVNKNAFPTDKVYGDTPDPEIRLVTCGGHFDTTKRSYDDNVIVYGHMLSHQP